MMTQVSDIEDGYRHHQFERHPDLQRILRRSLAHFRYKLYAERLGTKFYLRLFWKHHEKRQHHLEPRLRSYQQQSLQDAADGNYIRRARWVDVGYVPHLLLRCGRQAIEC